MPKNHMYNSTKTKPLSVGNVEAIEATATGDGKMKEGKLDAQCKLHNRKRRLAN